MITIVAVQYLEPDYNQTLDCLKKLSLPVIFVDRKGIGSLAEAYNRGFKKVQTEYTWFISNITFKPDVPTKLLSSIHNYGGVSPKFASHHKFIRIGKGVQESKFVEFTAPLIRSEVYKEIQLDENLPYWGHDIVFGIECEKRGIKLAIDHTAEIEHTYIWDSKPNPITEKRKKLRLAQDKPTEEYLNLNYPNWKQYL